MQALYLIPIHIDIIYGKQRKRGTYLTLGLVHIDNRNCHQTNNDR